MDEITFLTLAAKEVMASKDERLKTIYEWCKAGLGLLGSCGGNVEHQAIQASLVACDIHLYTGLMEETGEYLVPHPVDTVLNEKDAGYIRYYYQLGEPEGHLTISMHLCDPRTYNKIPKPEIVVEPLQLKVKVRAVQEESNTTASGIILSSK